MPICCICNKEFSEYGNNPWPFSVKETDVCCDLCDSMLVIPARVRKLYLTKTKPIKGELETVDEIADQLSLREYYETVDFGFITESIFNSLGDNEGPFDSLDELDDYIRKTYI